MSGSVDEHSPRRAMVVVIGVVVFPCYDEKGGKLDFGGKCFSLEGIILDFFWSARTQNC